MRYKSNVKGAGPGMRAFRDRRLRRKYNESIESALLTALSMNGRISFNFLSDLAGIEHQPVYRRVKILEKRYKIRYTAEIDVEMLGYLKFLIMVKFDKKIPTDEEIISAVASEPKVQLASLVRGGAYDLLFYALAENNVEIQEVRHNLVKMGLDKYDAKWYIVPFTETYNFVPLRNDFMDTLESKVLKRYEIRSTISSGKRKQILRREFAVLKELNLDGKIQFKDIDSKYGFDIGRAQYAYHKLLEAGLLKRVTITMQNPQMKYVGTIFATVTNHKKFAKSREKLLKSIIEDSELPLSKYLLVGDIGEPYGFVFFVPVFEDGGLEEVVGDLSNMKGVEITASVVTKMLYGNLCCRRFDRTYSQQYGALVRNYKMNPSEQIKYNEIKAQEKEEETIIDLIGRK